MKKLSTFLLKMTVLFLTFSIVDNEKPAVNSSPVKPVEDQDSVVLTCASVTNDAGAVYEWYKKSTKIDGETGEKYSLTEKKRTSSGSYTCKVKTTNTPISVQSNPETVTILCKFCMFYYIRSCNFKVY